MSREPRITGMRRWFRLPTSAARVARDVDDEIGFHLDARVADLVREGVSPDAAWAQARREFGDLVAARGDLIAVDQRRLLRVRIAELLWTVRADLRYAGRQYRRAPGLTAVIVGVLAVGIGANAGGYTFVRASLTRPAPGIPHPEQLMRLTPMRGESWRGHVSEYSVAGPLSTEALGQMIAIDSSIGAIAGWVAHPRTRVTTSGGTVSGNVLAVTAGYFPTLRLPMRRGIGFGTATNAGGDPGPFAVVSERFWRRELAGDSGAVGLRIAVNGVPLTIVGVAPPRFNGVDLTTLAERVDVWVPMAMTPALFPRFAAPPKSGYINRHTFAMVRLASGVSPAAATARLSPIAQQDWDAHPQCCPSPGFAGPRYSMQLRPLTIEVPNPWDRGDRSRDFALVRSIAALVLLTACATAASLLLARAASRRREIAIRLSLGAARGRVIRQLLTESASLALVGALLGLVGLRWTTAWIATRYDLPIDLSLDSTTVVFGLGVAVATTLLFGMIPALHATRSTVGESLKSGSIGLDTRGLRWQGALTIAQIALSSAFVCATGVFVGAALAGKHVDVGIPDPEHVITATFDQNSEHPSNWDQMQAEARRLLESIPGVTHVAWTEAFPLVGGRSPSEGGGDELVVADAGTGAIVSEARRDRTTPWRAFTGPEFFAAAGLRILQGRIFARGEKDGSVVITEDLARRLWPGQSAIGRTFDPQPWGASTVVGVVPTVHMTIDTLRATPVVFSSDEYGSSNVPDIVVIRTSSPPDRLMPAIRRVLTGLDARLNVQNLRTLAQTRDQQATSLLDMSRLAGILAAIAMAMAAAGVFSVIAFSVEQRRREIGIRMALGARGASVARRFFDAGMRLTLAGIAIGVVLALGAARIVVHTFEGIGLVDYSTLAVFAAVVPVVAALAIWIPARRATRVDPVQALRAD